MNVPGPPQATPALLYCTARYWPGSMAIRVHADLVRALAVRGWPGAITTLAPPGQKVPVVAIPDGDLPVYRVAISRHLLDRAANRLSRWRYAYTYLLTASRYLRPWLRARLAAQPGTMLQVEMAYPMGAVVRRAIAGDMAKVVITLHGGDVLTAEEGAYGYARAPFVRQELQRIFRWATAVRAMSPLLARRAQELGCPEEKLSIIPLNLSDDAYPTAPTMVVRSLAHDSVRAELGLPTETRLLLGAGRILPIKGFDLLIAALPTVLARHPSTHLVLYGPDRGGTVETLRAQLEGMGLVERVHVLGEVSFAEQRRFQAAADLAVIPSLLDGFNRFGVEAAAHGTPLVVSTGAGLADYVRDFGAGRVVPLRDVTALATAITALLDHKEEWREASSGAIHLAAECRTERVAAQLVRLYERIASSAPQRFASSLNDAG